MVPLLATLVCAFAFAAPAAAQSRVPQNDGWVTDLGELLTPEQERSLEALMESYEEGTRRQVALLTVPDLGGRSLEDFALEVARGWGVGEADKNTGALLLVSRDDRKIRIEVGYGLEGELTDAVAGRIIRNVIAPGFRQGDYYKGLREGIEAIHAALGGDYAPLREREEGARGGAAAGLAVLPFLLFMILMIAAGRSRRRHGRSRGGVPLWPFLLMGHGGGSRSGGGFGGGFGGGGGGFGGFGGGGFGGGGASGGW